MRDYGVYFNYVGEAVNTVDPSIEHYFDALETEEGVDTPDEYVITSYSGNVDYDGGLRKIRPENQTVTYTAYASTTLRAIEINEKILDELNKKRTLYLPVSGVTTGAFESSYHNATRTITIGFGSK